MYQRPLIEQIYCQEENLIQSVDNEKLDRNKLNLYANIFVEKNQIDKKWHQVTEDDIMYMIDKFIEYNQTITIETEYILGNRSEYRLLDSSDNRPYSWTFQILEKINNGRTIPNLKGIVRRYTEINGDYVLDTKNENYKLTCIADYETDAEVREIFKEPIQKIQYS